MAMELAVGRREDGFVGCAQVGLSMISTFAPRKGEERFGAAQAPAESSSFGEEDVEDVEVEEVRSSFNRGLACLAALEESLPIKRGLSNYFMGKSRSFASLCEVTPETAVKDLAKVENPFNKRRRVIVAHKYAAFSRLNASIPACLDMVEDKEYTGREDKKNGSRVVEEERRDDVLPIKLHSKRRLKMFASSRSYSFSDLIN